MSPVEQLEGLIWFILTLVLVFIVITDGRPPKG